MYRKAEKIKIVIREIKSGKKLYSAVDKAEIGLSIWYLWEKKIPRLKKLRKGAERVRDGERVQMVENSLFTQAIKGNMTAIIFFLTNQVPERWKDRRALINNVNVDASKHDHYVRIYRPEGYPEQQPPEKNRLGSS